MAEYIKKYEVLVKLQDMLYKKLSAYDYDQMMKMIKSIPSVEVDEGRTDR